MKGILDLRWMKHSTANGTSHAVNHKKIIFLKLLKIHSPVKVLFHKETLIQGQAILDIAYKKCT